MLIVDTHCHVGKNWFEPVELLLYQMDRNSVEKAVLIQYWGMHHNDYMLECLQRFPGRFAAVVSVDTSSPDALAVVEELAQTPGVAGLRLKPSDRSPGDDPYAIWRKAGELNLPISCYTIAVDQTADPDFHRLVESVPDTKIVLEHLAGVHLGHPQGNPAAVKPPYTIFRASLELNKYPNTYLKFNGLGEFCSRRPRFEPEFGFDEVPPILEMAYEAFGCKRIMWGSDYPPVSVWEGYRNALLGPLNEKIFAHEEEKEWAFGKTALSVWRFE
ncbi:MAG: amidohydrolase family protein [bacterium]